MNRTHPNANPTVSQQACISPDHLLSSSKAIPLLLKHTLLYFWELAAQKLVVPMGVGGTGIALVDE